MTKHIEIMRADPVITIDGKKATVTGRANELFRLLVLARREVVSNDTIASLRDNASTSVGGKVRVLRDKLSAAGCGDLICNDRAAGYRLALDGWTVDAHTFHDTIRPLNGALVVAPSIYANADAAKVEVHTLKKAINLWRENPAGVLPIELDYGPLYGALKDKAQNQLIMALLHTQQHAEIREAIQYLEHRNRSSAEDITWELQLLAYDALGNTGQVKATWRDLIVYYDGRTPKKLSELMNSIAKQKHINPFRVAEVSRSQEGSFNDEAMAGASDDDTTLKSLCRTLGISTASQLRLQDTLLTPEECIKRAKRRLYFSGVLASKWVIVPAVRSQFAQMLKAFDADGGKARFLMINPKSDGYKRLCELRQGHISLESVEPLKDLASKHPSLEVRAYDALPSFRIVIIDNDVVSFSPYRLAAEAYQETKFGWEAPHVVLDPAAKYPLAEAFIMLFEETWKAAIPLGEI